jgi:hypothetical protein
MDVLDKKVHETLRLIRARKVGKCSLRRLFKMRKVLRVAWLNEVATTIDVENANIGVFRRGHSATINGWDDLMISEEFRVHTKDELRLLYEGFRFPEVFRTPCKSKFTGEEVLFVVFIDFVMLENIHNKMSYLNSDSSKRVLPRCVSKNFSNLW